MLIKKRREQILYPKQKCGQMQRLSISTYKKQYIGHVYILNNFSNEGNIICIMCSPCRRRINHCQILLLFLARLERVKLREIRSQAKVIGTLVTFGGAVLMAFYKGPGFNLFHSGATQPENVGPSSHDHHTAGALYIFIGGVALSSFYILQVNPTTIYIHGYEYVSLTYRFFYFFIEAQICRKQNVTTYMFTNEWSYVIWTCKN